MNKEINQTVIERESSDLFCILICMMDAFLVSLSCEAVVHIVFELTVNIHSKREHCNGYENRYDPFTECFVGAECSKR